MNDQAQQTEIIPDGAATSEELGAAVIVGGRVVAWFADFDEAAHEWCTENHFGQWLTWRATPPKIVPLTTEELKKVEEEAERLSALFKDLPEAD